MLGMFYVLCTNKLYFHIKHTEKKKELSYSQPQLQRDTEI